MSNTTAVATGHASAVTVADQIRSAYESLEPGQTDAWNPAKSSFELVYRLCLFHATADALRQVSVPPAELRILDIGSGNGRSTRMYLDLGLRPSQLTGLDLRPGAIALARELHPSIRFDLYDGGEIPFPPSSFNWIHVSTVMSSIKEPSHRAQLARDVVVRTQPGGYVFYFDLVRANDFAGHDQIGPESLFPSCDVVHRHAYDSWRFMQELDARRYNPLYLNYCRLKKLLVPSRATHEAVLLQKQR